MFMVDSLKQRLIYSFMFSVNSLAFNLSCSVLSLLKFFYLLSASLFTVEIGVLDFMGFEDW